MGLLSYKTALFLKIPKPALSHLYFVKSNPIGRSCQLVESKIS